MLLLQLLHSNTTLVKVKLNASLPCGVIKVIQIQLLLKLNDYSYLAIFQKIDIQIQLLLKLNANN